MLYKIVYKDGSIVTVLGTEDDVRERLKARPDEPVMITDFLNNEVVIK